MADSIAGVAGVAGVAAGAAAAAGASLIQPAGGAGAAAAVAGSASNGAAATGAQQKQAQPDLHELASSLNQYAQNLRTSLHFQVDHTTGELVISVIDTQTNQVLMQVPNQEALAVAQSLARMQAQLLQQKA